MRFEHFANNLGDTGGRKLRKARKVDTRHRAELINQAVNRPCVSLLNLINMPRLTFCYHRRLPYFRASK
jgi:hypothetical protein